MLMGNRKVIGFLVLILLVGFLVYKYKPTSNKQLNTKVENLEKSSCELQLENQSVGEIEKYDGIPKKVNFENFPEARRYYTRITETISKGANFASHYSLAYWGCGTDCFGYSIVDANNGEVIAYSPTNENYHLQWDGLNSAFLTLDPVSKGEERKFFKIIEEQGRKSRLELTCTEIAKENMYGLPE